MLALIAAEMGSPAAAAARRNVAVSCEVGSRKVQSIRVAEKAAAVGIQRRVALVVAARAPTRVDLDGLEQHV